MFHPSYLLERIDFEAVKSDDSRNYSEGYIALAAVGDGVGVVSSPRGDNDLDAQENIVLRISNDDAMRLFKSLGRMLAINEGHGNG